MALGNTPRLDTYTLSRSWKPYLCLVPKPARDLMCVASVARLLHEDRCCQLSHSRLFPNTNKGRQLEWVEAGMVARVHDLLQTLGLPHLMAHSAGRKEEFKSELSDLMGSASAVRLFDRWAISSGRKGTSAGPRRGGSTAFCSRSFRAALTSTSGSCIRSASLSSRVPVCSDIQVGHPAQRSHIQYHTK